MSIVFPSPWGPWGPPWAPHLPRLALELPITGRGMFDGAWWPRTDDARTELTDLVTAVGVHLGPIHRLAVHRDDWRDIPQAVLFENLEVKVSAISTTANTVNLIRSSEDQILLLVVPPATDSAIAYTAMAAAASEDNRRTAAELLGGTV